MTYGGEIAARVRQGGAVVMLVTVVPGGHATWQAPFAVGPYTLVSEKQFAKVEVEYTYRG